MSDLQNSPLLQSAQNALLKQLEGIKSDLQTDIRGKRKALKDAKTKREDLGVELFGYQQQLRGLFKALEESKEREAQLALLQSAADAKTKEKEEELKAAELLAQERLSQVDATQADLEKLAATIRQMKQHYSDTRGKVAVTKRETYAAEEALQNWEREKQEQDTLVLHLNRRIDDLKQKIQRLKSQAGRQLAQKAAAEAAAAEQAATFQKLQGEIKDLLKRWQEAVTSVQQGEEECQRLSAAAVRTADESKAVDSQIASTSRELAAVARNREKLAEHLARTQKAAKAAFDRVEELSKQRLSQEADNKRLHEELAIARKTLTAAKGELKAAETERQQAERELESQAKKVQAKKEAAMAKLQEASLSQRDSQLMLQDLRKLQATADEKEAVLAATKKELKKLQVKRDKAAKEVEAQLAACSREEEEIAVVEQRLTEAEAAGKLRVAQIEKYTRDLDAANRKLGQISSTSGPDVHLGPLEATIAHLKKELAARQTENQTLQRQWIVAQRELLSLQATVQTGAVREMALSTKHAILKQRCVRLSEKQRQTEAEVKALEKEGARQRSLLAQYDSQIAAHNTAEAAEIESALVLRQKAAQRLNEEEDAIQVLKSQIEASKQEKEVSVQRLLAAEAEAAEWEGKLQLGNELLSNLPSSSAAAERKVAARQRLHRLQRQEEGLQSVQQKLIQEIEAAIDKREVIATKGRAFLKRHAPTPSQLSEAAGRRRVTVELQRTLKKVTAKSAEVSADIERLSAAKIEAEEENKELQSRYDALSLSHDSAAAEVEELEQGKAEMLYRTSNLQKKASMLEKLASGEAKLPLPADQLEKGLEQALQERSKLMAFLKENSKGELQAAFQRLYSECAAADC